MSYQLQLGTLNLRAKIKQSFCIIRVRKCVEKYSAFRTKLQTCVSLRSQNIYSIEQQLAMAVYGLVSFEKYPVLV